MHQLKNKPNQTEQCKGTCETVSPLATGKALSVKTGMFTVRAFLYAPGCVT